MSFFRRNVKKIIIFSILLLIIMCTYWFFMSRGSKVSANYLEHKVRRKDIKVTISGTGVLNPSQKQDLSAKVAGTVKKVYFKEGDRVSSGSVLFEIDDRSVVSQIEKLRFSIDQAKSDLEKTKNDISNLIISAHMAGRVSNMNLKAGDSVSKGMEICSIEDISALKLLVPFNGKQIEKFYIGQEATVYVHDYMRVVKGTVNYIDRSGRIEEQGARVYDVEVLIDNLDANIGSGVTASAEIGGAPSLGPSMVERGEVVKVKAQVSGTVASVGIRDNENVQLGQQILVMENDEPERQAILNQQKLDELNLQMEQLLKDLEECKGVALFDGIIIQQDVNEGDYVKQGEIISKLADYGRMEFDIYVDELDIINIKVGMDATVTASAIPGRIYSGKVIRVASEGNSQGGVATYPVTIAVENPEQLMGGMNANAEIVIEEKQKVLAIPLIAVQRVGNQSFVLVYNDADNEISTDDNVKINSDERVNSGMQRNFPNLKDNNVPAMTSRSQQASAERVYDPSKIETRRIEIGVSDDSDIEVLEGLQEDDIILVSSSASGNRFGGLQPQMMGGMRVMGGAGEIRAVTGTRETVTVERRIR